MAARLRKDDEVQIMTGADKGRRGKVLKVLRDENRAIVQGANLVKRHQKPRGMGQPGGIIEREASIHISNLMVIDPKTDKPSRVGFRHLDDGRKVRFAKSSNQVLEG